MLDHFSQLGLEPGSTLAEIKAAYHKKLKEFPAHSHPQEFKAIRTAYEALRNAPQGYDDFFAPKPISATIDEGLIVQIQQRAKDSVAITLEDLIVLTF
jgi:curved DNA-binding protein CbpA